MMSFGETAVTERPASIEFGDNSAAQTLLAMEVTPNNK
jgi:hypothetical protein